LAFQLIIDTRTSLKDIEDMFAGGETSQTRAYALAGAFVHDLLRQHGSTTGAEILSRMNDGASFEHAFLEVVGMTPEEAETNWETHRLWTEWLFVLTSSTVLWLAVTSLALLAIVRRQMKNREIERKWAEENDPHNNINME